ncbi:ImmA/IrrE family metallo-endopeptidase [Candidatus Microgenomates bacterium]|nr:MAG: ImmA/IrrE family metallo-endopeptidase [Candidatus Microgenomates bacterium]
MIIKVIKNDQEYQEALKLVDELMDKNPQLNTPDAEKLELLTTLVQNYEESVFSEKLPDPIDALLFRMEQQGLTPDDLVTYIGSRSKVSEILSRKRTLSLNMIKALQDGLGIPAKVLLNQQKNTEIKGFNFDNFPVKEMIKRGYLQVIEGVENAENQLETFFASINGNQDVFALLNKTSYIRSPRPMNQHALLAWVAKVVNNADNQNNKTIFKEGSLTQDFLKRIIDVSDEDQAIYTAIEMLKTIGICVVVEPHMPQTYLDGAAIMIKGKNPIVGMTVRHDRLDNFWFTLLHELAHISLHYGKGTSLFYDDVESVDRHDPREKEADDFAIETMIPEKSWNKSPASILPSVEAAKKLAEELSIHPAVVAGRMRYRNKYFTYLNSIIGQGEVRTLFPDVNWKV